METITVEAVNTKPFNAKYSTGSVLVGGKWMQVAKGIDIAQFQKDQQITVELKTNDKGYTSVVGVSEDKPAVVVQSTKRTTKTKLAETKYEDDKNRRILVQGLTQAVLNSPGLISLNITNIDELMGAVEAITLKAIEFVNSNV